MTEYQKDHDHNHPHEEDAFYQQKCSEGSSKKVFERSERYNFTRREYQEEIAQGIPCNIYHRKNIAIALAYFSIGVVQSFPSTPLNIYLVETLNAEPQLQNTIGILQTLPWSMKLAFGFLSDAVPIYGMHRKPYFCMGSLLFSLSFISYYLNGKNNLMLLAVCIFMGTLGLIQMDVMADTMCVQRSKFEPEESKGQMQATCYSIRFAGNLVGAVMGATLCNKKSWGWGLSYFEVCALTGSIPFLLVTPFLFTLKEKYTTPKHSSANIEMGLLTSNSKIPEKSQGHFKKAHSRGILAEEYSLLIHDQHVTSSGYHSLPHVDLLSRDNGSQSIEISHDIPPPDYEKDETDQVQSISEQLFEIWQTVQLRSVWRPMTFVYLFNLFQVPNVAWQSYLQLSLEFPGWILGSTVILGSFMTFAGVLAYKNFFFKSSWRSIYVWTVMLTTFFSLMQLVLIFQLNKKYLHLNNYLFSLGDDVISAYISGIQFLPLCIMYMRLCPVGAEGASYAMLTTFGNIALVCASNIGNHVAGIWDVSNNALRNHNYHGLWRLNLLTSTLAILPLSIVFLLPKDTEEQDKLAKSQERSKVAGVIFLVVLIGSLLWNTCTALYRVLY